MSPAIRLEGVTRRFGRRWALRGVDLEVERGEVVAILGANGTGKTTLLRVIAALLSPTAGTAHVLGLRVTGTGDQIRRGTALMTPGGHAYEDLTGDENLRFAQRMNGLDADRAVRSAALERAGLSEAADVAVRAYSTGMRKRLEIARLWLRPFELVLLDEPFTSLDATGVQLVQDAVVERRGAGASVLIASHRVDEARRHADRTVRLEAGVISTAPGAEST